MNTEPLITDTVTFTAPEIKAQSAANYETCQSPVQYDKSWSHCSLTILEFEGLLSVPWRDGGSTHGPGSVACIVQEAEHKRAGDSLILEAIKVLKCCPRRSTLSTNLFIEKGGNQRSVDDER